MAFIQHKGNFKKHIQLLVVFFIFSLFLFSCKTDGLPSQNYFLDKEIISDTLGNAVVINYNYNANNRLQSISDGIRETKISYNENDKVERATYFENGSEISFYEYQYSDSDTLEQALLFNLIAGQNVYSAAYIFAYNSGVISQITYLDAFEGVISISLPTYDGNGNIISQNFFTPVDNESDTLEFKNTSRSTFSYSGLNPYALLPQIFEDMFPNIQNSGLNAVSQIRYQFLNDSAEAVFDFNIDYSINTLPTGFVERKTDLVSGVVYRYEYFSK